MSMEVITIDQTKVYDPRRNLKQMRFHQSLATYKLFGGAMGGGKTAALINEGNQLNLDYSGNFGLLMRKTWPSFRDTVLPQLEKFLDSRLVEQWNRSEKLIVYKKNNGLNSKIRYGGLGDDPDDWQKFMSGEYGWIAWDQAEDFTEDEFKMMATRLRLNIPKIKYYFLLSCNPNVGWIKDRFLVKNLPDHEFIPSLPLDNIQNLPADYIQRMRELLQDENLVKALLEGNWDAVGEPDNVYAYQKVIAAMQRQILPSGPVEIGVDVGWKGDDESVITLREGLCVLIFSKYKGYDTMFTCGEIWRCVTERIVPIWGGKITILKIKVDADGIGAGVVDRLREELPDKMKLFNEKIKEINKDVPDLVIEVVEIHGSAKPRNPLQFKNYRAEVHWALREMLDIIALPDDPEIRSQLMAIKYKRNSAGQIEILPKEEIKKKLGRSPDEAEGIIYSFAEPNELICSVWRI